MSRCKSNELNEDTVRTENSIELKEPGTGHIAIILVDICC
jgi:hypothetical protein